MLDPCPRDTGPERRAAIRDRVGSLVSRSWQVGQPVVGGEQPPDQAQRDHHGGGGGGREYQEHDDGLDQDGLQRGGTGEDEAGHGAGQEHQAGGLGGLDLRGHRGAQGRADVGGGGLAGGLAQGQAGFDLVAFVAQFVGQPPRGQHGRGHRVADHHPGDRDQGAAGEREDVQAEQYAQGDERRGTEGGQGQGEQVRYLGSATAGDRGGVAEHAGDPQPGPPDRPAGADDQGEGGADQQQLGQRAGGGDEDLALQATPRAGRPGSRSRAAPAPATRSQR